MTQEISHEVYMQLLKISFEVGYNVRHVVEEYLKGEDMLMSLEGISVRPLAGEDSDVIAQVDSLHRQVEMLKTAVASNTERVAHDFDHWRTQLNNRREQWFDDGITIRANKEKIQDLLAFMISHREIVKDQAGAISNHTEAISGILSRLIELESAAEGTADALGHHHIRLTELERLTKTFQPVELEQVRSLCVDVDSRVTSLTVQGNSLIHDAALLSDAQTATAKRMGIQEKHTEMTIKQVARHETDIVVLQDTVQSLRQAGKQLKGVVDTLAEYTRDARGNIWTKLHELVAWRDQEAVQQIRKLQVQDEAQARDIAYLNNWSEQHQRKVGSMADDITNLNSVTRGLEPDLG